MFSEHDLKQLILKNQTIIESPNFKAICDMIPQLLETTVEPSPPMHNSACRNRTALKEHVDFILHASDTMDPDSSF